jgi:hypothetical protein
VQDGQLFDGAGNLIAGAPSSPVNAPWEWTHSSDITYQEINQAMNDLDAARQAAQGLGDTAGAAADTAAEGALAGAESDAVGMAVAPPVALAVAAGAVVWWQLCDHDVIAFGCSLFGRDDSGIPSDSNLPILTHTYDTRSQTESWKTLLPQASQANNRGPIAASDDSVWKGAGAYPADAYGGADPGSALGHLPFEADTQACDGGDASYTGGASGSCYTKGVFYAPLAPTTVRHTASQDPNIPAASVVTADPNAMLSQLQQAFDAGNADTKQAIALALNQIGHTAYPDSYPTPAEVGTYSIPDCTGMTGTQCHDALVAAGFSEVTVNILDFDHADVTKPADAAVSISMSGGGFAQSGQWIDPSTLLTVNANPGVTDMPVLVLAIGSGELASDYEERLRGVPLVPIDHPLSDTSMDPNVGPGGAVRTNPAPGSRVHSGTNVTVDSNPTTAPTVGAGVGAPAVPSPPGVHVPGAPTPCNIFPFGIPCWLVTQMGSFVSTVATPPHFDFTTPGLLGHQQLDINLDHPFGADLSTPMSIIRIVLLVLSVVGLVMWLGGMAMGGSTGGGGSQEAEE